MTRLRLQYRARMASLPGSCAEVQAPRHTNQRRLAAVVLNHRTPDDALRAAASLTTSLRPPDLIIVVDNYTADPLRPYFESRPSHAAPCTRHPEPSHLAPRTCRSAPPLVSPESIYLHTGRNRGFSGGMNAGIGAALASGADLVLLVNSDVVVTPACLGRLEAALVGAHGAGIAGPLVVSSTQPGVIMSAGIRYHRRTGRLRVLGVGERAVEPRAPGHARSEGPAASAAGPIPREVDAVSGCLMLITRDVFDTIGWLDERYFFGFEDLDFCLRARDAGFSSIVVSHAVACHEEGRTIGRHSARRFYFAARNHLLVSSRRCEREGRAAWACRLCWVVVLNLTHAVTASSGAFLPRLGATLRGVRDYSRGRFGTDE